MAQIPEDDLPFEASAIPPLQESTEDLLARLENHVAQLAVAGASREQADEVETAKTRLQDMGDMIIRTVQNIDQTEIPLLPEKPVIDEEAVYQSVRSYVFERSFGTPVSTRELREHLRSQGVQIEAKVFGRWFANWRTEMEQDARDAGDLVEFTRVPREAGFEPGTYSLAPIKAPPKAGPKETAVSAGPEQPGQYADQSLQEVGNAPAQSTLVEPHKNPEVAAAATERAKAAAIQIVTDNPGLYWDRHAGLLADALSISRAEARTILNNTVAAGGMYRDRREGRVFYQMEEPSSRRAATTETDKPKETFGDKDAELAREVIEALAQFKATEYEKGLTARDVLRYINLKDPSRGVIGNRSINRIIRALEVTGITKSWQSRQGTGGSQFRIGAADRYRHNFLKDRENWPAIIEAARKGETLELPE